MKKLIVTTEAGEPLIFKCQNAWKNLVGSSSATRHFCDGGSDSVVLFDNIEAAKQQAKAGQIIALRNEIPFDEITQYKAYGIGIMDYCYTDPTLNLTFEREDGLICHFYESFITDVIDLYQLLPVNQWLLGFEQKQRLNHFIHHLQKQQICYYRILIHEFTELYSFIVNAEKSNLRWRVVAPDFRLATSFYGKPSDFIGDAELFITQLNEWMTIDKLTDIACLSGDQRHFNLMMQLVQQPTLFFDLAQSDIELLKSLLFAMIKDAQDKMSIAFVASLLLRLAIKDSYLVDTVLENIAARYFVASVMQLDTALIKPAINFLNWRIQQRVKNNGRFYLLLCVWLLTAQIAESNQRVLMREISSSFEALLSTGLFGLEKISKNEWVWLTNTLDKLPNEWRLWYHSSSGDYWHRWTDLQEYLQGDRSFSLCHIRHNSGIASNYSN